jgi:hypothetical protein
MTPGPVERRWTSRLCFKLFGRWPDAVVAERLAALDSRPMPEYLKAALRETYERAGEPVPREYR